MQNSYQVTLTSIVDETTRVVTFHAKDVYEAHKQAYFSYAQSYEDVSFITTDDGDTVFSENDGFLEEQIF